MLLRKILGEKKLLKFSKLASRFFALFLVAFIFWAFGLKSFVDNIPLEPKDDEAVTDSIIILTGGTKRFEEGLKLLAYEKAERLFVSGVGEDVTLSNLLLLSGYVPANIGTLAKNIELGYEAENTKGNAEEVSKWVLKNKIKSIYLVTANYHMPRSLIEFQKKMPSLKIVPYPVKPDQFNLVDWAKNPTMRKVLVSEYNKYLVTKIGLSV